jgi:hypothetical protein
MPIFEIEFQGKAFEVDAPDQASALAALDSMKPEAETTLAGVGKAAWTGLREGGAGLAGLPADALDLLGRMTGKGDQTAQFAKDYGSGAMLERVKGATGGMYEPKTGIEEAARTGGNFALGLVGGGASLPVKLATRVALPAAASEGAKALTEGTAAEPYAPIAGAIGGLAAGMGLERIGRGAKVAARPTRDAIATRQDDLYNDPHVKNLVIAPKPVAQFVDDLKIKIDKDVTPAWDADGTFKMLDKIKTGQPIPMGELDSIRKHLGTYAGELSPAFKPTPNARAAMAAKSAIDEWLPTLQQQQLVSGNAQIAGPILREAQKTAHVGFKMDKVKKWISDAEIDAGKSHSGGNLENIIYQKIAVALKNPQKHLRGWSKDEVAALKRVMPNLAESILRRGAKFLGGGGGLGQYGVAAGGAAAFGPLGAIGLPAVGMALNKAGSGIAMRKLNNVSDLLASGAPMYAGNRQAFQQSLQGPGILGRLPSPGQASLYTALMTQRPQPVQ